MLATFTIIAIIIFIASRMWKKNMDSSPGSKNWNYTIDTSVDGMKMEMENMEYMHGSLATANERITMLERDLERMNGINNLYKEFANSHKEEHRNYQWTEQIPN